MWALIIVALTCIPYVWGLAITPPGSHFLGLTHNLDDGAVYLSWMRQAADGHFFIRNLFTNEPQSARQFNLLFLLMGSFAGITHLPLVIVFHIFRILFGIGLILAIWQFSKLFLEDALDRRLLIPLVGLTAGIGWLIPGPHFPIGPVDTWQPEAITFLSIYLNPLFLIGQILILGALYFLTLAQRTLKARYAVCAGLALLLLGNIHTYDIAAVGCVWAVYLIVLTIVTRKIPVRLLLLSALAVLIALPSAAYQFYLYSIDPVYRARANSPIPSPAIWSYFMGYGFVLIGAAIGAAAMLRKKRRANEIIQDTYSRYNHLLIIIWSILGFALPYIPVSQQRKLVMGLHIPLCILCAYALSRMFTRLPRLATRYLTIFLFIISVGSNVQFLVADAIILPLNRTACGYPAYISSIDIGGMRYLEKHLSQNDTVLAPAQFALMTPAFTGHQVYYGHWSETPNFRSKLNEWFTLTKFLNQGQLEADMIRSSGASYLVDYAANEQAYRALRSVSRPLDLRYQNKWLFIFHITPDRHLCK